MGKEAWYKLSYKTKYVILTALSALLTVAVIYAVSAAVGYYSTVERINKELEAYAQKASQSERELSQFEHILSEPEHIVSDQKALMYFDDAVFVGDSRTEGLFLYSGIQEKTKAVSYAWRGFGTYDILNKPKFKVGTSLVSGAEALKNNNDFSKVYIMLGVNELTEGMEEEFIKRYDEIVACALQANPDARIIIQSIIPVSREISKENEHLNNNNVRSYNSALFEYAEQNGYTWLDVGYIMSDKNGNLHPEYDCGDGIHLNESACQRWFEYLCYYARL